MVADATQQANRPVTVTCFHWTCDLLDLGIRVETREY